MIRKIKNQDGSGFNDSRIISTRDIFLGTNVTSSLEEYLKNQEDELNQLKKWTKWYVKYGGMGSGGGGGTTLKPLCNVHINKGTTDTALVNNGDTVSLWGQGEYIISFTVLRGSGHTFRVTWKLGSDRETSKYITESSSTVSVTKKLYSKFILVWSVYDETVGEYIVENYQATIIPEQFTVKTDFIFWNNNSITKGSQVAYGVFSDVNRGFFAKFTATVSYPIPVYYKIRYRAENWETNYWEYVDIAENVFGAPTLESQPAVVTDVSIPLSFPNISEESIVGKKFTVELLYGKNPESLSATSESTYYFTIVPTNGFLVLISEPEGYGGTLSDNESDETLIEIKKGNFPFLVMLSSNQNEPFNMIITLEYYYNNSEWRKVGEKELNIRTNINYPISKTFGLQTASAGLFRITGKYNESIKTTKYFKVKEGSTLWTYDYYDSSGIGSSYSHTYYLDNETPFLTAPIELFTNESISIDSINGSAEAGTMFSSTFNLGLQYDSSNDDSIPFVRLVTNTVSTPTNIDIYQDKIVNVNTGKDLIKQYYLPKTKNSSLINNDWHLFTLAVNYAKDNIAGTVRLFEITVFIDGLLEGVYVGTGDEITEGKSLLTSSPFFNILKVYINPQKSHILKINLFDVCVTNISNTNNFTTYSGDSPIESLKGRYKYLLDTYISSYYNQYLISTGKVDDKIETDSTTIRDRIIDFYFDEYGLPYATADILQDILSAVNEDNERVIKTPVLILNPNENILPERLGLEKAHFDHPIIPAWFLAKWPEKESNESQTPETIKGNLYYIPSDAAGNITLDDKYLVTKETAEGRKSVEFSFSIQGSSTRAYGTKNIELGISQDSETDVTLFTPNFDPLDSNSFLPEKSFTLKADVVDSSTCNNNAIGDFVNNNTTPLDFEHVTARDSHCPCRNHIKNCLTGFPVLVFINITSDDSNYNNRYYFAGIYNFNLGRKSYVNLGYYDNTEGVYNYISEKLNLALPGTFNIISVPNQNLVLDQHLVVTEISQGNPHFDFSQYDETVLFAQETTDGTADDNSMFTESDTLTGAQGGLTYANDILQRFVKQVALGGGFIFETLKKNFVKIGEDNSNMPYLIQKNGISLNCVSDYKTQYTRVAGGTVYHEKSTPGQSSNSQDLINCITYYEPPEGGDPVLPYVDLRSLVEYYVICMCFGMVDSVLKNMELKTWTPNIGDHSTMYPAFYDMDTALGIDNAGESVDYFAFSDFWRINSSELGNEVSAQPADIYPDFFDISDKNLKGYDIPSSYLFAIAKYSYLKVLGFSNEVYSSFPRLNGYELTPINLYAQYRKTSGALKSADHFINTYFDRLKNIPNSIKNLNYRSKYAKICYWEISDHNGMIKDATGTITYNHASVIIPDIDKFQGSGKAKKLDWLTARLRLLDAYFNLNNELNYRISYPKFYNNQGTEINIQQGISPTELDSLINNQISRIDWENYITKSSLNNILYYYYPTLTDSTANFDLENTPILSEFISTAKKSQFDIDLQIKAPSYTPVIFRSAQDQPQSFLIGDDTNQKTFTISFASSSNQDWNLYGSGEFSWINNFGQFGLISGLTIKSDKLKNVLFNDNGRGGVKSHGGEITLNTPNIDTIEIKGTATNPLYTSTLKFLENTNYSRLSSIDLSSSQVSTENELVLPVRKLVLTNMKQCNISLSNLPSLTSVSLNSSSFTKLGLPIWDKEISITGNVSGDPNTSDYKYTNVSIVNFNLYRNSNITGSSVVKLNKIDDLETVVIQADIDKLYILNCDNLKSVRINESIKEIYIQNCCSRAESLIVTTVISNNTDINIIDLSNCTSLEVINFKGTSKFTTINIGQNIVKIPDDGLKGCPDLQYIDNYKKNDNGSYNFDIEGTYLIDGEACFYNDYKFTLRRCPINSEDQKKYPNIIFNKVRARNTFKLENPGTNIDFDAVNTFFSNNVKPVNSNQGNQIVGNIENLFYNQTNIGANWNDFSCNITDLDKFDNIYNARRAFYNTGITYWTADLFNFGKNISSSYTGDGGEKGLHIESCFYNPNPDTSNITYTCIMEDYLSNIGNKLTVLEDRASNGNGVSEAASRGGYYRFYSKNPGTGEINEMTEIKLKDILSPCKINGTSPLNYLKMFYNIANKTAIDELPITVDLKGCFDGFSNLYNISYFMWDMTNWNNLTYTSDTGKKTSCFQDCYRMITTSTGGKNYIGLKQIGCCFNKSSNIVNPDNNDNIVDLFNIFSQDQWENIESLFNINLDPHGDTFACNKKITLENFNKLTGQENKNKYLTKNKKIQNPANLFKNCNIIECDITEPILQLGFTTRNENTIINILWGTFSGVKAWSGDINTTRIPTRLLNDAKDVAGGWGKSIAYYLRNCTSYYGTYSNDYFSDNISFNFFDRRGETYSFDANTSSKRYYPNIIQYPNNFIIDPSKEYMYYISSSADINTKPSLPDIDYRMLLSQWMDLQGKPSSEGGVEEVIATDLVTDRWTIAKPTLSTINNSDPNKMRLRTNMNSRSIWVSSRSIFEPDGVEEHGFDPPEPLEVFNNPEKLKVKYTVYSNSSKATISSLRGLFTNTVWSIPCFKYDENWYTDILLPQRSYIKNSAETREYSFCYTDENCSILDTQYRASTEIDDIIFGRTEGNVSNSAGVTLQGNQFDNFKLSNYNNTDSYCYPIVPPDFLYGLANNVDLVSLFYTSTTPQNLEFHRLDYINPTAPTPFPIEGYFPRHLFINKTSSPLDSWITNCNILPSFVDTLEINTNNGTETYKVYSFIPKNFIPYDATLTNAFNFHIRIPGNNERYYILFSDSIKFKTSNNTFYNAFPRNITHGDRSQNKAVIDTNPQHVPINVRMSEYNFNLHLVGKYNNGNISDGSIEDLTKSWASNAFNSFISADLLYVLSGKIFDTATMFNILAKYVNSNQNPMCGMHINGSGTNRNAFGVNKLFKFPRAGSNFTTYCKNLFGQGGFPNYCIAKSSIDSNDADIWDTSFSTICDYIIDRDSE